MSTHGHPAQAAQRPNGTARTQPRRRRRPRGDPALPRPEAHGMASRPPLRPHAEDHLSTPCAGTCSDQVARYLELPRPYHCWQRPSQPAIGLPTRSSSDRAPTALSDEAPRAHVRQCRSWPPNTRSARRHGVSTCSFALAKSPRRRQSRRHSKRRHRPGARHGLRFSACCNAPISCQLASLRTNLRSSSPPLPPPWLDHH